MQAYSRPKWLAYKQPRPVIGSIRNICAVWNEEHGFVVELLTNNFSLAASAIAALYKARWEIEIFLRNLKTAASHQKFYRDFAQRRRRDAAMDCAGNNDVIMLVKEYRTL